MSIDEQVSLVVYRQQALAEKQQVELLVLCMWKPLCVSHMWGHVGMVDCVTAVSVVSPVVSHSASC